MSNIDTTAWDFIDGSGYWTEADKNDDGTWTFTSNVTGDTVTGELDPTTEEDLLSDETFGANEDLY